MKKSQLSFEEGLAEFWCQRHLYIRDANSRFLRFVKSSIVFFLLSNPPVKSSKKCSMNSEGKEGDAVQDKGILSLQSFAEKESVDGCSTRKMRRHRRQRKKNPYYPSFPKQPPFSYSGIPSFRSIPSFPSNPFLLQDFSLIHHLSPLIQFFLCGFD